MRTFDVLSLAITGLRQQKLRTLLTMLGVLFGSFVLAFTLSMRLGVQETIVREYTRHAGLRQIQIQPAYGEAPPTEETEVKKGVPEDRQDRMRAHISRRTRRAGAAVATRLTQDKLKRLQELPHVTEVVPDIVIYGRASIEGKAEDASIHSMRVDDEIVGGRLIAGGLPASNDASAVLVSEYLLYRLGIVDDSQIAAAVGKSIQLEYRTGQRKSWAILSLFNTVRPSITVNEQDLLEKVAKQLPAFVDKLDLTTAEKAVLRKTLQSPSPEPAIPEGLYTRTCTIAGVFRGPEKEEKPTSYLHWWLDNMDVLLPYQVALAWYLEAPPNQKEGASSVMLLVDNIDAVKETTQAIRQEGFQPTSLMELIEREQFTYLILFGVMTSIAAVALFVAALGIINTMFMSVLERTREIGIMKAVGGRHRQVMAIFLVEGFLIGLSGGILGLGLARLVSIPSHAWFRSLAQERMKIELTESIYVWPFWLVVGAPLFTCLVTTAAAVLPARRAARVNPIKALRHE